MIDEEGVEDFIEMSLNGDEESQRELVHDVLNNDGKENQNKLLMKLIVNQKLGTKTIEEKNKLVKAELIKNGQDVHIQLVDVDHNNKLIW